MSSEPFFGEIQTFSFGFAPRGFALCNGQLLPINQNQALFSLLGTTYGGDGQTNFSLPNLQGRTPIHFGGSSGIVLGQAGGQEAVTLTSTQAAHQHRLRATSVAATTQDPTAGLLALPRTNAYVENLPNHTLISGQTVAMAPTIDAGGSQAHPNLPPFLVLNVCIALQGIFPSRN